MIWYKILKVILILRFLLSPLQQFTAFSFDASSAGLTNSQYFEAFPSIVAFGYLNAFGQSILSILMYHDICKEAPKCIRGARNVMIFTIMLALGLSISYYSDLTPLGVDNEFLSTLYAQTAGSVIGVCILFIPTYFYLKKRFYSPGSVSEVMIEPKKAIPIRLLGVVDQKQRDRIIAEYMSETINPYTGHSIDNQSRWTIY